MNGDCDKCHTMAPAPWEMLESGVTKEEWTRQHEKWWKSRPAHMGCESCNMIKESE